MTSAEEALIEEIEGRIRHEPGCHECDLFRRVAAALASRVSTPPSEDWEYGTVSEITSAQVINAAHVDYWRSRGFDIVRRRRATEWEPVPAVPVLPTGAEWLNAPKGPAPEGATPYASYTRPWWADPTPTEPEEKR